jgi:hypothetical protein
MNDLQRLAEAIDDHIYGLSHGQMNDRTPLDDIKSEYSHLQHSDAYQVFRKAVSLLEEARISAEEAGELREAEEQKLERMFKGQR